MTHTEKYFLREYGKDANGDLSIAIKHAADREVIALKQSWPVDVFELALEAKMIIKIGGLNKTDRAMGLLITKRKNNGFIVLLRDGLSFDEKEHTIAHELGHALLFYRNGRHQIAILDKAELTMEEYICEMFAVCLLGFEKGNRD